MTSSLDARVRRLLRMQVVPTLLLCLITSFCLDPASHFRLTDPVLALGLPIGLVSFAVTLFVLAYQFGTARPSPAWEAHVDELERNLPLVIMYLVLLNVFTPILALFTLVPTANPLTRWVAFLFARYSTFILLAFFVLGAIGLGLALGARVVDRVLLRGEAPRRAVALVCRAAAGATGALCVWGLVLGINGALDTAPPAEHRTEVVRIWGMPGTSFWWADVRSWEGDGGVKRLFILPGIDEILGGRALPGQPLRVTTRPGFLGMPWVASIALDRTPLLEPLLAAAPTAATPRRWLIESLLQRGRWAEAVDQTLIFARHYPRESGFVEQVGSALKAAGQLDVARRLDRAPAGG